MLKLNRLIVLAVTGLSCLGDGTVRKQPILQPLSGGGGATGNDWSVTSTSKQANSNTHVSTATGAAGDILVVYIKWENTGSITALSGSVNGSFTKRGSQVDNTGLHCAIFTAVASTTAGETLTPTVSGTADFRDWYVWRLATTGTVSYGTTATYTGTGTSVTTSTFTTAKDKGIVVVGCGVDNASTQSSQQVGGNAATADTISSTSTAVWYYIHSTTLSSATATCTVNTSVEEVVIALPLTSQ